MKQDELIELRTHPLPRVLWIELTSKCPFRCTFCTRESLRGSGEHMDIDMYREIIGQLDRPRIIRLNYAGESGHYPHLVEAIRLAAATGAEVELVSALASLKPERLQAALEAGLSRLTVSLHTLQESRFGDIYGFSSLRAMQERLQQVLQWRVASDRPFTLDLAFVAMQRNLDELPTLATFAQSQEIEVLAIHPLIERDPLPMGPSSEHTADGRLSQDFAEQLAAAISKSRAAAPKVQLQVSSHELHPHPATIGGRAVAWPWPLPEGTSIAGCDQDPFETIHILADGRVVPCEVLERESMGNLRDQSLTSIWHNTKYRQFRNLHVTGSKPACNSCVYKTAHRPRPLSARLCGAEVNENQLIRGWYPVDGSGTRWSSAEAVLILDRPPRARHLILRGVLAAQNRTTSGFEIRADGALLHRQRATGNSTIELRLKLASGGSTLRVDLNCTGAATPSALGLGDDARELGFALFEARCE